MKHLLRTTLLLAIAFISFTTFAQKADTIVYKVWDNGVWENQIKMTYAYNPDCNASTLMIENWDNGSWIKALNTIYSYVSGSNLDTALSQIWSGSKWQDFTRITYSYTVDLKVDTVLTEIKIIQWTKSSRSINTYDGNGNLLTQLTQTYLLNTWSNAMLTSYAYNADGTVDSTLMQQWSSGAWENESTTKHTYNSDKTLNTSLTKDWEGTIWENDAMMTYTYVGGKLDILLTQDWENGAWVNDYQNTYQYNGSGDISIVTGFDWDGAAWANDNQTIFSYTTSCTLPLTLLDFNISKSNDAVLLNWETSNEVNTKGFNIQRSKDGINFSNIGFVASKGDTKFNTYNYSDKITSGMEGKQFYRLQMMDKDGKYTMSKSLYVDIDEDGSLVIYPNPVKNQLIFMTNSNITDLHISITDQNGRVVLNSTLKNVSAGQQNRIDVSGLSKGVFLIQLNGSNYSKTSKFIKL